eukprot:3934853-Pleurochrysis_carterae.AAC.2
MQMMRASSNLRRESEDWPAQPWEELVGVEGMKYLRIHGSSERVSVEAVLALVVRPRVGRALAPLPPRARNWCIRRARAGWSVQVCDPKPRRSYPAHTKAAS